MNRAASPLFTAAQMARALGKSKRAVLFALADVPATQVPVAGGLAGAWTLAALPQAWRSDLAAQAQRRLFPSVEALLTDTRTGWKPPVPLSQIDQRFINRATKLRSALAIPLARQHELTGASLSDLGLTEYRRAFGHPISAKQWRRLLDRAARRDGGLENWQRLDLYLDDAAFRIRTSKPTLDKARFSHRELAPIIEAMTSRENPTADDRAWLFHESFTRFEQLLATHPAHRDRRAIKATLIEYLCSAGGPALSRTSDAMRRLFDLKLAQWRAGGRTIESLTDKRPMNSGRFRTPDFSADVREIAKLAVRLDSNESGARRLLEDQGQLTPEFSKYYPLDQRRDKSALPKKVRRAITPLVAATVIERRGPKAVRDAGPYITRNWSGVRPGDYYVFDDVSWNHYFKFREADGSWGITRGECLVGTDEVSDYPLDFILIAGKYNGIHPRRLFAEIAINGPGLPRIGVTLENAVWGSRFMVGKRYAGWKETHWRDFESGLNDPRIGIKIHHARIHRAKTIESFFGRLEDRMRCLPGFVGFNERLEKMERMQALIARAGRGDEEALAQFRTQEQWRDDIRSVMQEFRHQPGNGDRLAGRTPAEAWNESVLALPLKQLPEDARHVVNTHGKIVRLHPTRGIVTKLPGQSVPVCYANEHTANLVERGETHVRVRIDLEHPELMTCSDMKGTVRFSVKGQMAHAKDATREERTDLARLRREHRAPAKTLFGEIQHDVRSNIVRDEEQDEETKEEGRFHAGAVRAHKAEEQASERKVRKIRREGAAIGASVNSHIENPDRVLDGIEWEKEIQAEINRSQAEGATGETQP